MPQRHPVDTQELQKYYKSQEFKKLIGGMFPELIKKDNR